MLHAPPSLYVPPPLPQVRRSGLRRVRLLSATAFPIQGRVGSRITPFRSLLRVRCTLQPTGSLSLATRLPSGRASGQAVTSLPCIRRYRGVPTIPRVGSSPTGEHAPFHGRSLNPVEQRGLDVTNVVRELINRALAARGTIQFALPR